MPSTKPFCASMGVFFQVCPPSVVCNITCSIPVAQPFCASANCTPNNVVSTGLFCDVQVLPPSVVAKITPNSPTAQPCSGVGKLTSYSSTSPGSTMSATSSGNLKSLGREIFDHVLPPSSV